MRIYLQTRPNANTIPRFYHLALQEDLLEGWTLVKETGYQGSKGKVSTQHFGNQDDALQAMLQIRDAQIKRGYQVVFVQGQTRPE
ncbi:MAG: WGR domain-containing protein [Gammaproteobacteria bacterium]|jgi:predicted DNA-binding WGR domain protein|nr:WGR domain-containing protein [Gammaproteobacteria bacterium]